VSPRSQLYGRAVCKRCLARFVYRRSLAYLCDQIVFFWVLPLLLCLAFDVALDDGAFSGQRVLFSVGSMAASSVPLYGAVSGQYGPDFAFLTIVVFMAWCLKDGVGGAFLGKRVFGLRVVDSWSGKPLSFGGSLKRNLLMIVPIVPLVVLAQVSRGRDRLGDGVGKSRVLPRGSEVRFTEQKDPSLREHEWLRVASHHEAQGSLREALDLYRRIARENPGSPDAAEAETCAAAVQRRLNELQS
jgi:uncharacterized RDD family membrane protein YckC